MIEFVARHDTSAIHTMYSANRIIYKKSAHNAVALSMTLNLNGLEKKPIANIATMVSDLKMLLKSFNLF